MDAVTEAPPTRTPLLRVEGLACMRGGRRVLDGIGLTLAAGELAVVTGPNGSGKTSLLRCLAGLLPLAAGTVAGPAGDGPAVLFVGHADPAKVHLTVAENLRYWLRLGGAEGDDIGPALAAFDLAGLADTPVGILSAGQRRRLSLSRLRLGAARVWLLDEPTNALDRDNVARLAAAVEAHCAGGGAALVATHDVAAFPRARAIPLAVAKAA
ncbi:MAG: heme ABC exporter ATP-binding protein CcmA [Alphaproteobacteria bacterium]